MDPNGCGRAGSTLLYTTQGDDETGHGWMDCLFPISAACQSQIVSNTRQKESDCSWRLDSETEDCQGTDKRWKLEDKQTICSKLSVEQMSSVHVSMRPRAEDPLEKLRLLLIVLVQCCPHGVPPHRGGFRKSKLRAVGRVLPSQ